MGFNMLWAVEDWVPLLHVVLRMKLFLLSVHTFFFFNFLLLLWHLHRFAEFSSTFCIGRWQCGTCCQHYPGLLRHNPGIKKTWCFREQGGVQLCTLSSLSLKYLRACRPWRNELHLSRWWSCVCFPWLTSEHVVSHAPLLVTESWSSDTIPGRLSPLATLPLLFRSSNWHTFLWSQESGGSARTDYRAIQLVKKKKQKGTGSDEGEAECAAVLVGKGLRSLVSQSQAEEAHRTVVSVFFVFYVQNSLLSIP